jgi:hypothetical protein
MAYPVQIHGVQPSADWTSQNPTMSQFSIGIESDTGKWKLSIDGRTAWADLGYANPSGASAPSSIVGITGTTAEFNTALTDANFATGGGTATGTNTGDGEPGETVADLAAITASVPSESVPTYTPPEAGAIPVTSNAATDLTDAVAAINQLIEFGSELSSEYQNLLVDVTALRGSLATMKTSLETAGYLTPPA